MCMNLTVTLLLDWACVQCVTFLNRSTRCRLAHDAFVCQKAFIYIVTSRTTTSAAYASESCSLLCPDDVGATSDSCLSHKCFAQNFESNVKSPPLIGIERGKRFPHLAIVFIDEICRNLCVSCLRRLVAWQWRREVLVPEACGCAA